MVALDLIHAECSHRGKRLWVEEGKTEPCPDCGWEVKGEE